MAILTKNEMRQQVKQYVACPHPTKKYRADTLTILCDMWKASQRNRVDLWGTISEYKHASSDNKINGNVIKGALRKFLQTRQKNRCCYCNRLLVNNAHAKPIEHILPRFQYPQFSLHFWNLAVACVDCNGTKLKEVWGSISADAKVYPPPAAFSDMYHPRFHAYKEHIKHVCIENDGCVVSIYKGITEQGRHLCLALLDKVAAKRILIESNDELQGAMSEIATYQGKVGQIEASQLAELAELINNSVLTLLNE